MRLESEYTFYRARFEIFPYDIVDDVGPYILQTLYNWICDKEQRRLRGGLSILQNRLQDGAYNFRGAHPERVSYGCYFSRTLLDGMSFPLGYDGGASLGNEAKLCSASLTGNGDHVFPQYWAMDYDEPDSRIRARRWHTSVGLRSNNGSCVVNIRITNYITPGYIGDAPTQPPSTTPLFVPDLISLRGCRAYVGETMVTGKPVAITATNFKSEFVENLISTTRELPIILVLSDIKGQMPIDVDDLAHKVLGMAVVYTINDEDVEVKRLLHETFVHEKPSGRFHVGTSWVRVYKPNVNLDSERDARRHRFFRPSDIEEYGDNFNEMLRKSLTRDWFQDDDDIIDVLDIDLLKRQERNAELRKRLTSLGERAERSAEIELATRRARDAEASVDGLQALLDKRDQLIEEQQRDIAEWQRIAEEYASQVDSMSDAETQAKNKMQGQIAGFQQRLQFMEAEQAQLEDDNQRLEYQLKNERSLRVEKDRELSYKTQALNEYESIEHIPGCLSEILDLFSKIHKDRVVVLKEAFKSAQEFDGRYRLDDELMILKSIPSTLWEIYFGDLGTTDIPSTYQSLTGFELALTETKATNNDSACMKQRRRKYHGETIEVVPHIKGRDNNSYNSFRVHYYVDNDRKLIVIGHCGEHLDTAGTRRNT